MRRTEILTPYIALLAVSNAIVLLPDGAWLRVLGAILLLGVLPGWLWSLRFFATLDSLTRGVIAAGFSYTTAIGVSLLLHYLPGPIPTWWFLVAINTVALLPLAIPDRSQSPGTSHRSRVSLVLVLLLAIAIGLRATNLHYSEFQGDEALAMISAAEALEGHEDALFLRSKGPAEVLLPMLLWRLTGTITEAVARLPFTLASLLAVITIFLIGKRVHSQRLGLLAAGLFAFNGFMVAFGRIVQYQALVIWFSALAFLLAQDWQFTQKRRTLLVSGMFLGTGLLAHYDAILALPAVGWLIINRTKSGPVRASSIKSTAVTVTLFGAALLLITLPFYLPFALDPQANRTGDYVGGRIGTELRNNLPDFFQFTTFYSSSYYLFIAGLLLVLGLSWLAWAGRGGWRWVVGLANVAILAVISVPSLLNIPGTRLDFSFLPFALLMAAAFLVLFRAVPVLRNSLMWQAVILWLAVPFLGYNFLVALGLTHIYTTAPAWALLAALGWEALERIARQSGLVSAGRTTILRGVLVIGMVIISTLFLWNAFVRHDIEYWQDYPAGNLSLYWTPFETAPAAGLFGLAHRAGWKAVGQKIVDGTLAGDYSSNEEPDVTTWYTRGAPRACDPLPEFYFMADDLVDPVDVPEDSLDDHYVQIGVVHQTNQKQLQILQRGPATLELNALDEVELSTMFDSGAVPAAFARSTRGTNPADTNFSDLVRLVGYDLDTRRSYPGGRIPVTLVWQALAPMEASYQVFTHLEGASGPVAQADGVPVCWRYPTDAWRPGQIVADQHAINLSADIPPGDYPLEVGLYRPDTFQRLDWLDEAGNPAGTSLTLAVITIHDSEGPK